MTRIALTQTRNAFPMPPLDELESLRGRMDEVRRANLEHHAALVEVAVRQGAQLIGFGELFTGPYFAFDKRDLWFPLAEAALDGPTATFMQQVARQHGVVLVCPLYEQTAEGRFNTAVVIDADGSVLGSYRKTHIPNGGNERGEFHEAHYFGGSDGGMDNRHPANISENPYFPVFETAAGRVGVAICYDRHFAGVTRSLARNGAQLVLSPAVTFGKTSERLWPLEFAVDAARHQIFIGGSNRLGAEPPWDIEFFGESHVVGPEGPAANLSTHPELIIADVDLESIDRPASAGWRLVEDHRPRIYGTKVPRQ